MGCKCQLLINSSEMPRAKVAITNKMYLFGYLTNQESMLSSPPHPAAPVLRILYADDTLHIVHHISYNTFSFLSL